MLRDVLALESTRRKPAATRVRPHAVYCGCSIQYHGKMALSNLGEIAPFRRASKPTAANHTGSRGPPPPGDRKLLWTAPPQTTPSPRAIEANPGVTFILTCFSTCSSQWTSRVRRRSFLREREAPQRSPVLFPLNISRRPPSPPNLHPTAHHTQHQTCNQPSQWLRTIATRRPVRTPPQRT